MDLTPYVDELRHQLLVAAAPGGDEARELAERLTASIDAAARLVLLDALSVAVDEITLDLAPGRVELRLRQREPEFIVTSPMTSPDSDGTADLSATRGPATLGATTPAATTPSDVALSDADDGATARLTLRMPETLKLRIDEAAARDGLSVNSWLVRTVGHAVQPADTAPSAPGRPASGGQRYTGWVGS